MSLQKSTLRPLCCWKRVLRQARCDKTLNRPLSTIPTASDRSDIIFEDDGPISRIRLPPRRRDTSIPPSMLVGESSAFLVHPSRSYHKYPIPNRSGKRPQITDLPLPPPAPKTIKTYPPPPSTRLAHKDPIASLTTTQLATLDPSGARQRLFSRANADAAKVGDILLVRLKNGDPFAGICMNIRRRGVDTGILLRNQLTRVGVEMWFKVFSPNVDGMEVVQRREKRARRARLYYLRKPKHDIGSVQGIVQAYQRQRAMLRSGDVKGRDANAGKKKKEKKLNK